MLGPGFGGIRKWKTGEYQVKRLCLREIPPFPPLKEGGEKEGLLKLPQKDANSFPLLRGESLDWVYRRGETEAKGVIL